MKKRLLITLVLMLGICTNMLAAIIDSGKCGTNVTYTLTDDGVLTIQGTGSMHSSGNYPWYYKRSSVLTVKIEQGVTSIGDNAFRDCSNLTSVTIPNSVTSIGSSAFYNCI